MEATASTLSASTWYWSTQKRAFASRKLRTSCRPRLNTSVPQSGWAPMRAGVLVQGRAVEARQGELVAREMGRHPVDDHPDAAARARRPRAPGSRPGLPKRAVGA